MSYYRVVDAIDEHDLSWNDIDRILLNERAYNEFCETVARSSNYSTTDVPAVRETTGQEKILYIESDGRLNEIVLP